MPAKRTIYRDYYDPRGKDAAAHLQNLYDNPARHQLPAERGARPGVRLSIPEERSHGIERSTYDPRVKRAAVATAEQVKHEDLVQRGLVPPVGKPKPTAGNIGKSVPRGLPGFRGPFPRVGPGQLLDLLDIADGMARNPVPWKPDPVASPYMTLKCQASPFTDPANGYNAVTHYGNRNGHVNAADCGLGLQAWENATWINSPTGTFSAGNRTYITLECKVGGPGPCTAGTGHISARYRYAQVWWAVWPVGGLSIGGRPHFNRVPLMPWSSEPDPNDQRRRAPSMPIPRAGEPHATANPVTDIGTGLSTDLGFGSSPWLFYDTATGTAPELIGRGRDPDKNSRERKSVVRTNKIGAAIFEALDNVSEWAEVVDCVYKSLPKKTRQRWEKDRGLHWVKVRTMYNPQGEWIQTKAVKGLSIFGNAGQYGLDGADWKSEAIGHNFSKVDIDAAMKCIVINHLEDKFYGAMHRALPKNTGNALDQSQRAVAEFVEYVQETLGL